MKMNKAMTTQEKVIILALLVVLGFACYWNFVQRPVTEDLQRCASEKSNLDMNITILETRKQLQDQMSAELEEIKAQGDAPVVPDYDNLDKVMSFLNNVLSTTKDYSLSVQSVVKSEEGSANIVRRSMTLKFTSPDYDSAKAAIKKLQESEFCCRLGAMSMTRNEKDSWSVLDGALEVAMNITFFERQKG